MTPAGFKALVRSDIRALVAQGERAGMTVHLNIVSRYAVPHPEWQEDCIPACGVDGDSPLDFYAVDPATVTCAACIATIKVPA